MESLRSLQASGGTDGQTRHPWVWGLVGTQRRRPQRHQAPALETPFQRNLRSHFVQCHHQSGQRPWQSPRPWSGGRSACQPWACPGPPWRGPLPSRYDSEVWVNVGHLAQSSLLTHCPRSHPRPPPPGCAVSSATQPPAHSYFLPRGTYRFTGENGSSRQESGGEDASSLARVGAGSPPEVDLGSRAGEP